MTILQLLKRALLAAPVFGQALAAPKIRKVEVLWTVFGITFENIFQEIGFPETTFQTRVAVGIPDILGNIVRFMDINY